MNARTIIRRIRHARFSFQERLICDGCGRERGDERRFVSGPSVIICDECASGIAAPSASRRGNELARAECSFCRSEQRIVAEWTRMRICAGCTELIETILAEDDRAR